MKFRKSLTCLRCGHELSGTPVLKLSEKPDLKWYTVPSQYCEWNSCPGCDSPLRLGGLKLALTFWLLAAVAAGFAAVFDGVSVKFLLVFAALGLGLFPLTFIRAEVTEFHGSAPRQRHENSGR